jgi:hypothetical protein
MPAGFVVTHAFKQNITGGAFESLAAATGDVLSVANYRDGSRAWIVEAWGANSANAADFGLRSPRFHDNSRGLRMAYDFAPRPARRTACSSYSVATCGSRSIRPTRSSRR